MNGALVVQIKEKPKYLFVKQWNKCLHTHIGCLIKQRPMTWMPLEAYMAREIFYFYQKEKKTIVERILG